MIPELPAFLPGAPGGPEILILLFLLFFLALPIAAIVVLVLVFGGRWGRNEADGHQIDPETRKRLAEVELEVERLRERVDEEE